MAAIQDKQRIKLDTPLGKDIFLVQSLTGQESESQLFQFTLQVITELSEIDQTKLIGKSIGCAIACNGGAERYVSGIVRSLQMAGIVEGKFRQFTIELMPWLGLLEFRSDCRIFQALSVPDIISEVFKGLGFNDFSLKLQATYPLREYCVQYRETDFAFVTRLMEEEGIYYFFKHEKNKHTLVLSDHAKGYEKVASELIDVIEGTHSDHKISQWRHTYQFCSGAVSHTDYDFMSPATSLMAQQSTIIDLPNTEQFERYDFPGSYTDKATGDGLARKRMEAIEATYSTVEAISDYPNMIPGHSFKVGRHPDLTEAKKKYVLTSVSHEAKEGSYRSGDSGSFDYRNQFQCVPEEVVLRPLARAVKPYIGGTQTAVVVGPSAEEIYTDKFGRIKVQFFWDRLGKKDENSSCWIRVAQIWSGKKWGAQFIPRVGQEVVISFLEGDPDRPIIVGSVPNGEQVPPYDLPASKAISGIKTRSTKGGSTENFNEIRFEDETGKELFYLHAEKDQQQEIESNQTVNIGNDASESIGNDSTLTIGHDYSQTVSNDQTLSVGSNQSESVGKNMALSVGENRSLDVGKNHSIAIGGEQSEAIGKSYTLDVAKDVTANIGGKQDETIAKEYSLKAKKIQLSADDEITIKVGKASISMKKNGDIVISGGKINIKGSGDVVLKGSKITQN